MATPPVRIIAERRVVDHLAEGAVSAADAIDYEPLRPSRARAFDRLKGTDVLRTDGKGRWWLDEGRWDERRHARRSRAAMALLAAAIAGAFVALR